MNPDLPTTPSATTPSAIVPSVIVIFDIDGVVRDVSGSYRRALADTVEHFTSGAYRPSQEEIDALKAEGLWNNDWEASRELFYRYFEAHAESSKFAIPDVLRTAIWRDNSGRGGVGIDYKKLVTFFQSRYRGPDPEHWTGYICEEPLLLQPSYLDLLTEAGIQWGFFSGATNGSASYILEKRLGLKAPVLVAMEDAPGKPDPTGLLETVRRLEQPFESGIPVIYVGDTVADMYTVENAHQQQPERPWIGVGILPPHVQVTEERSRDYAANLEKAGAAVVFWNVEELTPEKIWKLLER